MVVVVVGGELVHGAADFRISALDTRSAKSLVVVSSTIVTTCMVCLYMLVLVVAPLEGCGGMCVRGRTFCGVDDLGISAFDTRSAKGLPVAINIIALSCVLC